MSLACPSLIANHFPDLCRAVDIYCERTSPALDAEPVNALTNVAFLISAGCAWRLQSVHRHLAAATLIRTMITVIAIIGLGSFLFHTVATRWAEWGDVVPILIFMLLYLWFVLGSFFGWPPWLKLAALTVFTAVTLSLEAAVPSAFLRGGALYLPALAALIAIGAALYRMQPPAGKAMFAAAAVFVLSFAFRTLDNPICGTFPLGTHFMWHILNAVLLYLLVRTGILYAAAHRQAVR